MKKVFLTMVIFALAANVLAQLEVNSLGKVGIGSANPPSCNLDVTGDTRVTGNLLLGGSASNFLGTTGNVPITFKVNNTLAGSTGSSADYNVSFGYQALNNNLVAGAQNVAVGVGALYTNNSGFWNTAIGAYALYKNTGGESNTAVGIGALYNNLGSYNTAFGVNALMGIANGSWNTAIGCDATVIGKSVSNATAIGYGAAATASDQVRIGDGCVSSIGGQVNWSAASDGRAKKNIRAGVPGLSFIKQLQPVMYNYNLDALDELQKSDDPKINAFRDSIRNARSPELKEIEAKSKAKKEKIVYSGFIAQDVEKAAQSIGYDFSGVDAPENGKGPYGLRYAEFVVPLVKAVQELSEQNARLQEQIDELKGNASLRSSSPNEPPATGTIDPVVSQCKLYQNTPNPFSLNTEIRFYVPESVKKAQLCIYNLQGAQIKQIVVTQRGEGSQWISGSELNAGIYLYALIVDSKEVDVKRMMLTE